MILYLSASCRNEAFRCNNGECIPLSRRCDGFPVCSDAEDERNCCEFNRFCLISIMFVSHICAREVCRITIAYTIGLENVLYKISACYIYSMLQMTLLLVWLRQSLSYFQHTKFRYAPVIPRSHFFVYPTLLLPSQMATLGNRTTLLHCFVTVIL